MYVHVQNDLMNRFHKEIEIYKNIYKPVQLSVLQLLLSIYTYKNDNRKWEICYAQCSIDKHFASFARYQIIPTRYNCDRLAMHKLSREFSMKIAKRSCPIENELRRGSDYPHAVSSDQKASHVQRPRQPPYRKANLVENTIDGTKNSARRQFSQQKLALKRSIRR